MNFYLRAEFDEKVRISREEAESAIDSIPEIENKVIEAETATDNARQTLGEAVTEANDADRVARASQETAAETLQVGQRSKFVNDDVACTLSRLLETFYEVRTNLSSSIAFNNARDTRN